MANSSGFEMKAHEQTYTGFLKLLKFGALACFLVTGLVIYLIAH